MIYYHYHNHDHDFILFFSLFASESTSKLWCCSARLTWGRWLCHNDQHKYDENDGDNYDADGPMAIMTTIMMTMIEFEFKGAGYADGPKEEAFESSGGEKVDPFAISTKISFP